MAYEQAINELRQKDAEALAMGGAEKLAKRKAEGLLNARERIEYLVDPGSFSSRARYARSHRPEVKHKTPADGKIAGFAKHRRTRDRARVERLHRARRIVERHQHEEDPAREAGRVEARPAARLLGESSGARMPDRMGAAGPRDPRAGPDRISAPARDALGARRCSASATARRRGIRRCRISS